MGLLSNLVLLPVTGPYRSVRFLLEQIRREAQAEMFDERGIQADLMALGLRLDLGEITEGDYLGAEAVLLDRLNQARALREEQAAAMRDAEDDWQEEEGRIISVRLLPDEAGDEAHLS